MGVSMRISVVLWVAVFVGCGYFGFASQVNEAKPLTRTYFMTIWLPRFDGDKGRPTFKELEGVLKDGRCVAKQQNANWNIAEDSGHKNIQFGFVPMQTSDLGDIAKALSKLGGEKNKPVARVNLALGTPISEAQFDLLKKELAQAKGIDWTNSDRSRLALEELGGAKFGEIRSAYLKAGATLADAFKDK